MNDLIPQDEWKPLLEVAKEMEITPSAIRIAFSNHPEIKALHYKVVPKSVGRGREAVVTREGMALLTFRKSSFRGNQHVTENPGSLEKAQASSENLNKAQDSTALAMAGFMKDPVIAMRMEQLRQREEIDELKAFKDQFQPILEDTKPLTVTAAQRQYLNDRVRTLAIKSAVPFPVVWRGVHDQVGRRSVEDYKFEDYAVAIKYLKKTYSYYGIEW